MTSRELARCPDDNTLGRLVAGELTDAERADVERHLGGCAACAQLIAEYARATPRRTAPERYQLIRRLGAGAMGEVWEAEDTALGRRVALKFVRPDATADPQYQARLIREARALARLRHPHVVAIHDLGQGEGGELFVALELIEGTSARAWHAAAPRTAAELLAVWRTVADALAAVHRAGIVHRDLKPDNVFIANDGRVVIGDFGLATMAADGGSMTLTASGQIVGTPLYMPLEQLRGGAATARSDQFALCVCLWEALVGARPFQAGGTLAALVVAMRARPAVPLRRRGVCAVLARGLDPDPERRWPDIPALIRALDRARARRWWLAAVAGAVLALAGALALGTRL
ncbi:MAG TPA: protein kinase [Kofleriaceae bacterium]|jgi:serine/threonine protein kinase|nr:protein kinase [Kofleriaceae bacterium]